MEKEKREHFRLTDLTLLTPPPEACTALEETPSPLGALLPGAGRSEEGGAAGLLLLLPLPPPPPFAVVVAVVNLRGLSNESAGTDESTPIPLSSIAAGGRSGLCRGDASLMPSKASESRAVVERERAAGTPAEGGLAEDPSAAAAFDDLVGTGTGDEELLLLPPGGALFAPVLPLLSAISSGLSLWERRERSGHRERNDRRRGRTGGEEEQMTKEQNASSL